MWLPPFLDRDRVVPRAWENLRWPPFFEAVETEPLGSKRRFNVYDLDSGRKTCRLDYATVSGLERLTFLKDSKTLVITRSSKDSLRVFDAVSGAYKVAVEASTNLVIDKNQAEALSDGKAIIYDCCGSANGLLALHFGDGSVMVMRWKE
jgi:hypothetical protein